MFYFIKTHLKKVFESIKSIILLVLGSSQNQTTEWRVKSYVLSYLMGVFMAVIFWKFFIQSLVLSIDLSYGILIILIVTLGLSFVFTTAIKCISILTCVGLVGKTGRGFLRAMCMTYVISGPLLNLASNGQEIVRVFACTTVLTYNLTKTRFDLMTRPFQNTLSSMRDEIGDIQKSFGNIEDVLEPIKKEIEMDSDENSNSSDASSIVERFIRADIMTSLSFADPKNQSEKLAKANEIKAKYSKKMQNRCKEQLLKGENRCKDAFSSAHDKCMEKLPAVVDVLLCWPLKIDYICNMKLMGYDETDGGICDPGKNIDPNLGNNIMNLKETERDLFANVTDVKVSFEVIKVDKPPQLKAAQETANAVMEEVTTKKKSFYFFMSFMQRILSFAFIKVIYASITYHRDFLRKIDFDNLYITPYFKKIDQRRHERKQHTLLPLKKFQHKILIDSSKPCSRTKNESRAFTFLLLQLLLEIFVSGFFLILDHMIVVLLRIIAAKSEITYRQEGEHVVNFSVNGTGLMARLMRSTLKNFNMHERVSTFLTNEPCLPKPSALPTRYYLTLVGLYVLTLLLIVYSTLTMRSRMHICAFFYRKRQKQRILHLYNKLLKDRKILFKSMLSKVKDDIEAHKLRNKLNILMWLSRKCPVVFGWLRWFECARRSCLICAEKEPRSVDALVGQFIECETHSCYMIYCEECWLDIGEMCVACQDSQNFIKYCEDDENLL